MEHAAGMSGERIELRISVSSGRAERDLIVHAAPAEPVGRLAQLAARELGESPQLGLWCERRREQLDGDLPLGHARIRWGDRLLLAVSVPEPTCVGGAARVELLVTGGPCAGERFQLGDGAYLLGRDPGCDIAVSDPSLSRHHLDLQVSVDGVKLADAGSANGTAIDGEALPPHILRELQEHDEVELGRTMLRIRPLRLAPEPGVAQRDGRLDFNRPPRVNRPRAPFSRELPAPPDRGRKAHLPLAASLVPLGAGLLLFFLLKSPVMLAIAGLSPLMAISTYFSERRGGKQSFARGSAEFRSQLASAISDLDRALTDETAARRVQSPDAASLLARVRDLTPSLWERRPEDDDFLCLRIGVADLPARSSVQIKDGGDADMRAQAIKQLSERETVPSVPLTLDLRKAGVVGLAGAQSRVAGLARWLLVQAAILHSPGELVVMAALSPAMAHEWAWLKWLPHLRPDRVGLQSPAVAIGRRQAEDLLAEVRDLLRQRQAQARARVVSPKPAQLLLLIDEETGIDRALVSAVLTDTADMGVATVWLGHDARNLPGQAGAVVEFEQARAVLCATDVSTGAVTSDVSAEAVPLELAARTARMLAPIRDISELARAGDIPQSVGLLGLLGLLPPTSEALQMRWQEWRGDLRVTVGVGASGPLTFDLRSEGPHALIAGTTGSGKSELLRTLVAAAAAVTPPHRLSFLLVDYKGGAAFAPCATLPHVLDIVSDLDEHLAERALISLNAELKRRERILADSGAKDLLELMRRDPDVAPPLLVIAVDEFAKLREEVPEFVDGVVDIAQRGRSLGVHMVLAAQTLRNAFTSAIRANTNLRLALRVAEESESEDMIASPLAARIPSGERSRGRAFARTGHGELRELQAAYVSGRSEVRAEGELQARPYELERIIPAESSSGGGNADSDIDSDLVALGEAARDAQQRMGLPVPSPPWLPTLPRLLALEELQRSGIESPGVAIGRVDLPHLQRQDPLVLDLHGVGHLAVFGAGNSGKTTVLTSAAIALARSAAPEELCIYALDAASGMLAGLAGLPHCGAVVNADDEERVHRLLGVLRRRIQQSGAGRSTGTAPQDGPRTIVLLLDDLGSFAHQYDRPGLESPYEQLQQILASGRAAGVHVILTASRRGALPPVLAAHVGQRLVLRMPSEEDMLSLGLDAKTIRGAHLPAGRGFTQDSREFHIAVPTRDGATVTLEQAVGSISGKRAMSAPAIEVLPAHVSREWLAPAESLDRVPVGSSDEDLGPATVDLTEMHLLVVGPYRSGRSTALETLAHGVRQAQPSAVLHLISPRRSPLRDLDIWSSSATNIDACTEAAASLLETLQTGKHDGEPAFLFIDDGGELNEAIAITHLERLVRAARDSSLRVVAAVEAGSSRGIANSWIREMRREGHGLLLQPDLAADGDLLAARLPRRVAAPLTPGRGFLVVRGSAELIQVAC